MPRDTETVANTPYMHKSTKRQGRTSLLMDSPPYHAYSYETFIFTLGAPHEEVQGRQTKGF